jgi:ABC-2 type transport system ATP-binding protein
MNAEPEAVRASGLSKRYRHSFWRRAEVHALCEVNLSVQTGSIFGLIGPNGAGKTTLLKVLTGAVHPSAGEARIFGHPAGSREAARLIGYLPDAFSFPGHLTALQLLELHSALMGLERHSIARRGRKLLDMVGIAEWRNQPLEKYSKGMRQRASIVQAMLHKPRLLILDEPTDGLDPAARAVVLDVLRKLNREGVTLFINSHQLDEVQTLCDRVVILDRGTIVSRAEMRELSSNGFVLTLRGISNGLRDCLARRGELAPAGVESDLARFHFALRADVDWAIDRVRLDRGSIEALEPSVRPLAEVFLAAASRIEAP